jgi:Pre-PUA-like domain
MDNFLPKKDQFKVVKCHEHIELLVNSAGDLIFFRYSNGSVVDPKLFLPYSDPTFQRAPKPVSDPALNIYSSSVTRPTVPVRITLNDVPLLIE